MKPKRGRKPATSKAKETEVEEKPTAKKTTKKTTTTKMQLLVTLTLKHRQ